MNRSPWRSTNLAQTAVVHGAGIVLFVVGWALAADRLTIQGQVSAINLGMIGVGIAGAGAILHLAGGRTRVAARRTLVVQAVDEAVLRADTDSHAVNDLGIETAEPVRRKLSAGRWLRLHWDRTLAVMAMAAAPVSLVLGWWRAANALVVTEQVPYLISGGLGALVLVGVGGTFWISADLRDQWRKLDRIDEHVAELIDEPTASTPARRPL